MRTKVFLASILVLLLMIFQTSSFTAIQAIQPTPTAPVIGIPPLSNVLPDGSSVVTPLASSNVELVGFYDTPGYAYGVAVVGNYAYVADRYSLRIINISNPAFPVQAGFYNLPFDSFVSEVVVVQDYAFLADTSYGLRVINVANPANPVLVVTLPTPGEAHSLTVVGDYVYIADGFSGLQIINVANPPTPYIVGFFDTPGDAYGVTVVDEYAYVADGLGGLQIINVTNPAVPIRIGVHDTSGFAFSVVISGVYAYIGAYAGGVRIINIASPTVPKEVGCYLPSGLAQNATVEGEYAFVAVGDGGLSVGDVANPLTPYEAGYYTFSPGTHARGIAFGEGNIYLAIGTGIAILRFIEPTLVYEGPLFLPDSSVMVNEEDNKITMGDHVHLQLRFRNVGNQRISNAAIVMNGPPEASNDVTLSVFNGTSWSVEQQLITLTQAIEPGSSGVADFWIYAENKDPTDRQTNWASTWLEVRSSSERRIIHITLSPILFPISENSELAYGSCLHNPDNIEIHKYAQYAAGYCWKENDLITEPCMPSDSPTSLHNLTSDPDTPEQAIYNLVHRERREFEYNETSIPPRMPDMDLLRLRGREIGQCRHYADLTTGLLRSLGLPSRVTTALLVKDDETEGHAWVEAYLEHDHWDQVDTTNAQAFNKLYYADAGYTVNRAYADKYTLGSATSWSGLAYRCILPCYEAPVDCPRCIQNSNTQGVHLPILPLCAENVTSDYRYSISNGLTIPADEQLVVATQAPTLVTRTEPFTLIASLVNSTTQTVDALTATLSIYYDISSTIQLYDIFPDHHTFSSITPHEVITTTWVVTPLLAGSGLPIRVTAFGRDLFGFDEHPLVINEPDTLPPLTLGNLCAPGTVQPGHPITLSAYVLDETLQPLTDTLTTITATLYATPTLGYSATVNLTYCPTCQSYQYLLSLPADAPAGSYLVEFSASRPGYDSDQLTAVFYVRPNLDLEVDLSHNVIDPQDALVITAQVLDRSTTITNASVRAEIITPSGNVLAPLTYQSEGVFALAFRPMDLSANLDGTIKPGIWSVPITADYLGSEITVQKTIYVKGRIYLPLILR